MGRGNKKAVQGGRLIHFSPSQLKTFMRCRRLWAAEKVLGLTSPPTKPQVRGTSLHKQPERWFKLGKAPTHEAVLAALPALPARDPALLVEAELTDPVLYIEDVRFDAHSDLVVPPALAGAGCAEIIDHKFVESFRYALDPASLARDVQMLTYAYWATQKWPEVERVKLRHMYYIAEGSSNFRPVRGEVTREAVAEYWVGTVVPLVQEMRDLAVRVYAAGAGGFLDAPGNFENDYAACRMYRGCVHLEPCGVMAKLNLKPPGHSLLEAFDRGL